MGQIVATMSLLKYCCAIIVSLFLLNFTSFATLYSFHSKYHGFSTENGVLVDVWSGLDNGQLITVSIYKNGSGNVEFPDLMIIKIGERTLLKYGTFERDRFMSTPSLIIPDSLSGIGDIATINQESGDLNLNYLDWNGITGGVPLKQK